LLSFVDFVFERTGDQDGERFFEKCFEAFLTLSRDAEPGDEAVVNDATSAGGVLTRRE